MVQQKLPWGLIFLLGGGFALAEASKVSGMSELIADHLHGFAMLPRFWVMVISCLFATLLTQFSSNVAVANVVLPVLAEMSLVSFFFSNKTAVTFLICFRWLKSIQCI